VRNRIPTIILTLLMAVGLLIMPVGIALADDYPDVPITSETAEASGAYEFPNAEPSFNPDHISDAIVSLNVTGANFVDVLMILTQQAGVNFILDAYWNQLPSGHIREGFRPPGGPDAGGGTGGFGGGSGFNPMEGSMGGTVTMSITEAPFDEVFKYLMQAYNLDYVVFRSSPDMDPILYIGTRERLEQELGLGTITTYTLHYIDPVAAINFLQTMDLLPTTSGYGFWFYGGGNNGQGGGGGTGGGGGGSFGGGGGGGGFGGGAGFGEGLWTAPGGMAVLGLDPDDLEGRSII
jgi:uncharacterized membrane protein YgcG